MASRQSGFYVPGSSSADYVYSKTTDTGELEYEGQVADIGMEKQAAIQSLSKTYSDAVSNAYVNYLNSKRSIAGSSLGEGYKQIYLENQRQALQSSLQETQANASEVRQEIESSAASATEQLAEAYQTEVGYMDRVKTQLSGYWTYLSGLTKDVDSGVGDAYLSDEQKAWDNIDDQYSTLFGARDVANYVDSSGNLGKTFLDWAGQNIGTTEAEQKYYQWLIGGGYSQFQASAQDVIKQSDLKKARQTFGTSEWIEDISTHPDKLYSESVEAAKPTLNFDTGDFGHIDFGVTGYERITNKSNAVKSWAAELGLSDEEIKQLTGYSVEEGLANIADIVRAAENGGNFNDIFTKSSGFNEFLERTFVWSTNQIFKSFNTGNIKTAAKTLYNEYLNSLQKLAYNKYSTTSE